LLVPEPHAPEFVVVVDTGKDTGGTTRTSSTKSAVERYVKTEVVHGAPVANMVVIVDVVVAALNEPVRSAFIVVAPDTVVTLAALG